MLQYLIFIGAAVNVWGILAYVKDTLQGQTKPNRVTWFLWALAPFIATAAAIADGVTWAVFPIFITGFVALLVFLASFVNPQAYWKLELFDYLCGLCSLLALLLWGLTHNPLIAIIFTIIGDFLAALPTIMKSWKHPETESGIAYSTNLFNVITGFTAVQAWAISEYAFSMYLIIINILFLFLIYRRRLIPYFSL